MQTIPTWSLEEKPSAYYHASWMLYLTQDQPSWYHLSLPSGSRVCRLVQPDLWIAHLFQRKLGGGGGVGGWWWWWIWENDDNSNSLESLFSITWLWYWSVALEIAHSQNDRFHLVTVTLLETPGGCRRGHMSLHAAVSAAPEDLFHVVISFDCVPCPAPDLAHSFSSSGGEREQRRQQHGKVGVQAVWFVRVFFFFLEKPEKRNMVSIKVEKKCWVCLISPPLFFILPF